MMIDQKALPLSIAVASIAWPCYRTDPACRIAVWDVLSIQQEIGLDLAAAGEAVSATRRLGAQASQHRATLHGTGKDGMAECRSLCYLDSPACVWTDDEGFCAPLQHVYLLFGLAVSISSAALRSSLRTCLDYSHTSSIK